MTVKKKIAYVAGQLKDWRSLAPLEDLKDFEVEVHAIHSNELLSTYKSSLKLYVYDNIADMPGYMRGLEDRIHHCQLLVSREASTLATFQTTRIAKKYSIPNVIIQTEYRPGFYKDHQNITAIQIDNLQSASGFLAMSNKAEKFLQLSGVEGARIHQATASLSSHVPADVDMRRKKFRNYVGFKNDEIVVGIFSPLDDSFDVHKIYNSVKMLKAQDPYRSSKVKLVIVGNGPNEKQFKYKAYEAGVGGQLCFLHEDYQSYYWDLFAGLDVILHLDAKQDNLEFHDEYPRYLLDAALMNTIVFSANGSVAAQLLGDCGIRIGDDSEFGISDSISQFLDNKSSIQTKYLARANVLKDLYGSHAVGAQLNGLLKEVLLEQQDKNPQEEIAFYLQEAKSHLRRNSPTEALVLLEELLLRDLPHLNVVGQVWKLKGDAHTQMGHQTEAVEAYAAGIDIDPKNHDAYTALGFASLYGHSYKDAITFFKKSLGLNPNDPDTQLGLGIAYNRNNMHGESLYWIRKAAIEGGHKSKAMTVLIQSCMETPQIEFGIAALEKVIDSIGESGRLLMSLGRLYMKDGRSIEGNDLVQKALDMDASDQKVVA